MIQVSSFIFQQIQDGMDVSETLRCSKAQVLSKSIQSQRDNNYCTL